MKVASGNVYRAKTAGTVKVVRNGKSYTTYREFYERHKTNKCFDYVKYALTGSDGRGGIGKA